MLNKRSILVTLVLSGLLFSGPAISQQFADDVQDFGTWGAVTSTGNFGFVNPNNPKLAKVKWWMEGQGRFADDASKFSQGIIRPGIGYQITDTTSVWVGYAWAPTSTPYVRAPFDEQRLWQQLIWSDKFSWGRLTSRSRMEERWAPQGDVMGARYRHLLKAAIPLAFAPGYSYIIQSEAFVSLNDTDWGPRRGFDQNRFFTGLGYAFNKNISTEVGYMNQYIIRQGANYMGHNLVVNLFMNF